VNELALFAGAGGGILGGKLLGWRTVCAVEWNAYAASVLVARQNDGCLEPFPVWDDVQTFDGRPWQGIAQVVSGGFPCTDISAAGRGAGIDGKASGMWKHMARIIGEVRPEYVFVENSPMLTFRGLDRVLGDLSTLGFDARWGIVGAVDAGAPHRRDRIWIVAHAKSGERGTGFCQTNAQQDRDQLTDSSGALAAAVRIGSPPRIPEPQPRQKGLAGEFIDGDPRRTGGQGWWSIEPNLGRLANGVANRVDRLRCLGNGQVPAVVRLAWHLLKP
jgi:DNA (cytosine-5)-methyltransferase 1